VHVPDPGKDDFEKTLHKILRQQATFSLIPPKQVFLKNRYPGCFHHRFMALINPKVEYPVISIAS
jgi:hypothetical protein